MTRKILWFTIITMTMIFSGNSSTSAQTVDDRFPIIPKPVLLIPGKGAFKLSAKTPLVVLRDDLMPDAEILNQYIFDHYGFLLNIVPSKREKREAVNINRKDNDADIQTDGYKLNVDSNIITIEGGAGAGVFYGIQTLIQLLPAGHVTTLDIQAVQIHDYPRYGWRGMHLDVCRHFFSKQFVKKYIDYLALYKMNMFHWHLTEDQGWRIEIKRYPKLQQISAWRSGTLIGHFGSVPERYDSVKYGGYYSQEDVKEIIAYATQRHITIVPEIELPGHAQAALAAYPELSCTGGPFEVAKTWGVFQDVYCPKEETFTFLENVLSEVCDLFPGPFIHIGGDECPKDRWKTCPHCQALIKSEGLKDEHELQSYFIRRIEKFIHSKGKRMIGWDEILEGGLPPDATVMSWRGNSGGIAAAKQNHDVIMTPTGFCYFDFYQSKNPNEPLAIGGYLPLDRIYNFEPTPDVLSAEEAKHILGAQGNLWTEYIPTEQQAEYMLMPRLSAMAEVLWSPKESKNFDSYTSRLVGHFKMLDFLKVNYSKALFDIDYSVYPNSSSDGLAIELRTAFKRGKIHYTEDGTDPTLRSPEYKGRIRTTESDGIKATVFDGEIQRGNIFSQVFRMNYATGKEVVLANPPSDEYPRGGGFSLVNGVTGHLPWNGADWLGFSGTNLDATVDLGVVRRFSKVSLDVLRDESSWIYLPKSVEVFTSDDGRTFRSVIKVPADSALTDGRLVVLAVGKIQSRWIKVVAENAGTIPDGKPGAGNKAWLFADEIIVE